MALLKRDIDTHNIKAELQRIKPKHCVSHVVPISGSYILFDIEARCIVNAVPKRQREFEAGRAAARGALDTLGIFSQAIPRASDRRPIWPKGIVGSISHAQGFAAALVGFQADIAGVGVDIEGADPLTKQLYEYVLTPQELKERDVKPLVAGSPRCKISFVAKEALFKAVYPITRRFFSFHDAQVKIHADGRWEAALISPVCMLPIDLMICHGKWARLGHLIFATVAVMQNAKK
ncbi:MAG: 4'-phosphopantetheinyl transferase EntD [Kangiellaceae bacterium]|jgi:4'-phosphopantetheinyl transferase EntD